MMDVSNDEMEVDDEATDTSIELMDFPNEILLRVFQHFTDTHLLDMTRVCTRFEAIANETFAQRYNGETEGKYFKVFCISDGDAVVYLPIFEAFGKRMTALEIVMEPMVEFDDNYWLFDFIRDRCTSSLITHIIVKDTNYSFNYQRFFNSLPAITHLTFVNPHDNQWANYRYEHVVNFGARNFRPIETSAVSGFVQNNPQLQSLEFNGIFVRNPLYELSGKLNQLESLVLNRNYVQSIDLSEVTFEQLKSLTISLEYNSAANVLQAIERGCKRIEHLDISMYGEVIERFEGDMNDFDAFRKRKDAEQTRYFTEFARIIGTFKQLDSCSLSGFRRQGDFLEILTEYLPKTLTTLRLEFQELDYDFKCDDLLSFFVKLEHLKVMSLSSLECEDHGYWFFGLDWCHEFAAIGANREQPVRCEYNDPKTNVVATKDKCIINGQLRYWTGYESDRSQSKTHILDLNEKCIDKILEWLSDDEVSTVYQTCTALKKIAAKRIQSEVFHFGTYDIPKFEDWLDTIADDIRKLVIETGDNFPADDDDMIEILKLVRNRCSKNLIEFQINIAKTSLMDDLNLSFPNLKKLTIDHVVTAAGKVLPTMYCPKLKYLDIGTYEVSTDENNEMNGDEPAIQDFYLGISIENLTVLKIQYFDDVIANLFNTLSDRIRDQLVEFTVVAVGDPVTNYGNRVISMVGRFRNLRELNLVFPGIEFTNTVYLFERCVKLKKLSFGYGQYRYDEKIQRLLQNCKKYCNDLKVIQLVYRDTVQTFDEKICQFISDEFPNVELYNVMVVREAGESREYKSALWNKSSIPKDCEKPY